ncbi:hypothetical protein Poly41_12230 [Novipirellula artificiosorum]|uniref:Uncharacterized protein n=2 Tax=Novipirellula artificiosorum TaxID=2528016 RepID=A0A5C6DYA8_9BACT|nr:hypothetical protein Poly41_12230 [Novipirellula artificiosorum]
MLSEPLRATSSYFQGQGSALPQLNLEFAADRIILFSSRAFMGIGDSPVRSKMAGTPVNPWKRSGMTSQYS